MRQSYLTILFLLAATALFAQSDFLEDFNTQRLQKQQTGMLVLGTWAALNIAGGLVLSGQKDGVAKNFHLMNAGWNVINLGIAGLGYYSAMHSDPAFFDLPSTLHEQHKFQKILLFNAGLDVGYMLGGAYLIERSKNVLKNTDRLKGFGQSIILQGAFLFVFDLVNYAIHAAQNPALQKFIGALGSTPNGLGFYLNF